MNRFAKLILLVALVIAVAVPMSGIFAQGGDELPIKQGTVDTRSGTTALYAEPDINSDIVGQLDGGATVFIYEEEGLFVRVDGGWAVASQFTIDAAHVNMQSAVDTRATDLAIRVAPEITADVIKTVPQGNLVGVLTIDGLWAQVYDGEVLGWAFLADLAPVPADDALATTVQSSAVTVARGTDIAFRTEPDIQSDVVATVPADTAVQVLAYDGLFALAMLEDGTAGWTFVAALDIEQRAFASGILNTGPVNFQQTIDGTVVNYLPYNDTVLLLGRNEEGTWLQIRYPGQIFISGEGIVGAVGWIDASVVDTEFDIMQLPVVETEEE